MDRVEDFVNAEDTLKARIDLRHAELEEMNQGEKEDFNGKDASKAQQDG